MFYVHYNNKNKANGCRCSRNSYFPGIFCCLVDVGSHSGCSQVPVYILTYSSCVFPLLLVQHFMVRALTFKWKQPEQILRHSQAFQKGEIYFYCSINAARGSFTAAKLGLMIWDNSMYVLIRDDNGGIERGHRVCNLLSGFTCNKKRKCSLFGNLCGDGGPVRVQETRLGLHRVLVNISVFHRRVGDQWPTLDYCVQIDAGAVKLECQ